MHIFNFSLPKFEDESKCSIGGTIVNKLTSTLSAIDEFSVYNYIGWGNIARLGEDRFQRYFECGFMF